FINCDAPQDAQDIPATLSRLTGSETLRAELTFWMSAQEVAAIVLENRRRHALELIDQIDAERGG
ncbi:MAG TPA: hypothetical protein DCQ53_11470, partial [Alphaproteobacteria bacterium]|nr:hypothetical protein [Alphaproteobacteria bacterium]